MVPPIEVAGRRVVHPLTVVESYCRVHAGTLRNYDWLAGTESTLTAQLVRATRHPWMNSRITRAEERWFLKQAATAAWGTVDPVAQLRDADPLVLGGLYDDAVQLYQHFAHDRPRGVNMAKISKCLYLMRPELVPILDSRLHARYARSARAKARRLSSVRGRLRRAYWAAIRDDVCQGGTALAALRAELGSRGGICTEAADRLSDVRLLDILAWTGGASHDDADG